MKGKLRLLAAFNHGVGFFVTSGWDLSPIEEMAPDYKPQFDYDLHQTYVGRPCFVFRSWQFSNQHQLVDGSSLLVEEAVDVNLAKTAPR